MVRLDFHLMLINLAEWNVVMFSNSIKILGHSEDLVEYAEVFLQHNITGKRLLRMTHDDIKKLGITSYGHILEIHVSTSYFIY